MHIFEIIDKSGRRIRLTKERFVHIHKHHEMRGQIEQMEEALIHPDKIIPFNYDPYVHFYYRYAKERRQYLFVSVKYLNGDGFVITSFYADKIK